MKESDLGNDLLTYYKQMPNTEIYCEVQCAGIIDMVVKAGNIITAIECKMSFGLAVIEQAVKNLSYAHYSYVAVPRARRGFIERICKDYGVGVLTVNSHTFQGVTEVSVIEVVAPRFNRRIVKPRLTEYQMLNTPGVQNERWTSWGWFVQSVHTELKRRPDGLTHEELFNTCYRHYDRPTYLKNNLLTYIRSGVIKNVAYRDKRFYYTP